MSIAPEFMDRGCHQSYFLTAYDRSLLRRSPRRSPHLSLLQCADALHRRSLKYDDYRHYFEGCFLLVTSQSVQAHTREKFRLDLAKTLLGEHCQVHVSLPLSLGSRSNVTSLTQLECHYLGLQPAFITIDSKYNATTLTVSDY